jgi:hypothetical protein
METVFLVVGRRLHGPFTNALMDEGIGNVKAT